MRIVAGTLKGRTVRTPDGRLTRPTSERTREAIFNILAHASWAPSLEGARVMDCFAGSGALGFEALSRGAAFCLFVETSAQARGCIRSNIENFQLFGATRIHRRSATDLGPKPAGVGDRFDLVFLDPPYGEGLIEPAIAQLEQGNWVSTKAVIVAETAADDQVPAPAGWREASTRVYGAAAVTCLVRDRLAPTSTSLGNED